MISFCFYFGVFFKVCKLSNADENAVLIVARCLPHIVPNVLLNKREVSVKIICMLNCVNFLTNRTNWLILISEVSSLCWMVIKSRIIGFNAHFRRHALGIKAKLLWRKQSTFVFVWLFVCLFFTTTLTADWWLSFRVVLSGPGFDSQLNQQSGPYNNSEESATFASHLRVVNS